MRNTLRGLLVLAAALGAASCDVAPESATPPPATVLPPADADVAVALYAGTPRTPPGFLADDAPLGYSQVTTYHLKSQQVAPPAATQYELCTDDWNVAYAWSEEVAAQSPVVLDLVANDTTARYFEFDRVPRGQTDRYVRMRVFRCSYVDPGAGILNARPLDVATLRDFSEYVWRFTLYNNADNAVLASDARVGASGPAHALTIASLERAASAVACDRIVVREWTHGADAATGALELTITVVREFFTRRDGATVVGC